MRSTLDKEQIRKNRERAEETLRLNKEALIRSAEQSRRYRENLLEAQINMAIARHELRGLGYLK